MQFSCDCGQVWQPKVAGQPDCLFCGSVPLFIKRIDQWRGSKCGQALLKEKGEGI